MGPLGIPLRTLGDAKVKGDMSANLPEVSIIIPTYNRCADLRRMLDALCAQTFPHDRFEVLVVADGCTDGTQEMLKNYRTPFTLQIVEQPNQGPAAARNQGASLARGSLFLFLDDDVEPTRPLVEVHVEAHRHGLERIVIGPYPSVFKGAGFLHLQIRAWWDAVFKAMLEPGHRFSFKDSLSGNLSVESTLFHRSRGFDVSFQVHEDYEFGMRMIKAGVPFSVAPNALAYHHQETDLRRSLIRKRQEGHADVLLARRHPELVGALPLADDLAATKWSMRILRFFLGSGLPAIGEGFVVGSIPVLDFVERMRLRSHWRCLFGIMQKYWYWRGVAEGLKSENIPLSYLLSGTSHQQTNGSESEIDLGDGVEAAEGKVDRIRPGALRIRYGQHFIGCVCDQPGAEPLRGVHLRTMLANTWAVPFLGALALEGKITNSKSIDGRKLASAIRARAAWFGPSKPEEIWWEQYSQWNALDTQGSDKRSATSGEYWSRVMELEREIAWLEHRRHVLEDLAGGTEN